jgi:predicted TIM-barrel fold metal-dependent hydrolase
VVTGLRPPQTFAQEAVPNSSGTETPKLKAPVGACDCHHHIYDPRFPFAHPDARMITNARVPDYRQLQRRLGINRSIVVTPVPFPASVADNLVTLDALAAFGTNARGIAIVYPDITDAELKTLTDGGIAA